jgi:septum formation protein
MKILLASGSPRRKELLETLGHELKVIAPGIPELDESSGLLPEALAVENARLKGQWVFKNYGLITCDLILAADTVVFFGNQIFGKPTSSADAAAILTSLSGTRHKVVTGYCLLNAQGLEKTGHVVSEVWMRDLTAEEISSYVATGECMDKAGAFAVSGLGGSLIREVSGSITAIMGLPVEEVLQDARKLCA